MKDLQPSEVNYSNIHFFFFISMKKRKSRTEKEKHERLNGSSHQGLRPRTPKQICHVGLTITLCSLQGREKNCL